jgi:biotin carboxyl carrier protein
MTKKMKAASIGLTLASLAIGLTGCAGTTAATKGAESATAAASTLSGKVMETMDGGGYTYVLLDKEGKKTWAAIPATKVKVGDDLKLLPGAEMPGFHSKALNRSFEMIIFSGGLLQPAPAAAAPAAAPAAAADAKKATGTKAILAGKVVETIQAATYTYLLIEKDGERAWAAVPTADVKVGEEVELIPGIDMGLFKSATLNRSFDAIHFSAGVKESKEKKEAREKKAAETKEKALKLPEGHPKTDGTAAKAPAGAAALTASITGKVVETVDGGGYTYLCVEKGGEKTWAAIPASPVKVGQEVTLAPGNTMKNFESKSLKRTFEKIIFTRMQ